MNAPSPFDQALAYVLGNEGQGFTDNPLDSGGPTKFGVTQKAYMVYEARYVPSSEIEKLTIDAVKPFYRDRYWLPPRCDLITRLPIATSLFDTGVLYGVTTAVNLAQKAVNECGESVQVDGRTGPKTIAALNLVSPGEFLEAYRDLILARISAVVKLNARNSVFQAGWTNRANRLLTLNAPAPLNGTMTT